MRRATTATAALVAALTVSFAGTALAGEGVANPRALAAKQCAAEKKADKAAFKAAYGKHAMRNCIRAARGEAAGELKNAAQECKAERAADPQAFMSTYGTNGNGRNAFGKCVSSKVAAEVEEDAEAFDSAAAKCREERAADPDAFTERWGTNAPRGENARGAKRNAFGKCVSATAKELEDAADDA